MLEQTLGCTYRDSEDILLVSQGYAYSQRLGIRRVPTDSAAAPAVAFPRRVLPAPAQPLPRRACHRRPALPARAACSPAPPKRTLGTRPPALLRLATGNSSSSLGRIRYQGLSGSWFASEPSASGSRRLRGGTTRRLQETGPFRTVI